MFLKDHGDATGRATDEAAGQADFEALWPSESRGDGSIKANNRETGAAQGRGSLKRKVSCKQCGYLFDTSVSLHDGGSMDGNGGGGTITKTSTTYTNSAGVSVSFDYGDQAFNPGGGCPLCFSRNGAASLSADIAGATGPVDVGF